MDTQKFSFQMIREVCTLCLPHAGGFVEIALAVIGYITVNGLVVLFLRFTNERDTTMHAATAKWIEETTHA
jgi:hypothetical protein